MVSGLVYAWGQTTDGSWIGLVVFAIPARSARDADSQKEGYDPVYDARLLRRFISHEVETRIGRALLSGDIDDGATITLDADNGELVARFGLADCTDLDRKGGRPSAPAIGWTMRSWSS
ncbi:hypothetical protein ACIBJI_32435 [Nocardia sp. NPDC050408]|uniref:hypothetical protein n=1 Tax=Nocardia sp. NPDC050408 TaxID=3364319 RepID=UPI0037AA029D